VRTVEEALILSSGKRPVRISQMPNRVIPRFRPAKLLVNFIMLSFMVERF
jgi:hypothetical protein